MELCFTKKQILSLLEQDATADPAAQGQARQPRGPGNRGGRGERSLRHLPRGEPGSGQGDRDCLGEGRGPD